MNFVWVILTFDFPPDPPNGRCGICDRRRMDLPPSLHYGPVACQGPQPKPNYLKGPDL